MKEEDNEEWAARVIADLKAIDSLPPDIRRKILDRAHEISGATLADRDSSEIEQNINLIKRLRNP